MRLYGKKAIEYAAMSGGTIQKHNDPTGPASEVGPVEAAEIAAQDPNLIFTDTLAEDAGLLSGAAPSTI